MLVLVLLSYVGPCSVSSFPSLFGCIVMVHHLFRHVGPCYASSCCSKFYFIMLVIVLLHHITFCYVSSCAPPPIFCVVILVLVQFYQVTFCPVLSYCLFYPRFILSNISDMLVCYYILLYKVTDGRYHMLTLGKNDRKCWIKKLNLKIKNQP